MKKTRQAIDYLKIAMNEEGIDPRKGLGDDLFLSSFQL